MDFFDPQKQKEHTIRLAVGYVVIGLVLLAATTILLYRAKGFGVDKHGQIIQNGLVFVSSHPSGADIYVNGKRYKDATNTRMDVPAGQYVVELRRDGYRPWKRGLPVGGGKVTRFDYLRLFPTTLAPVAAKSYAAPPSLFTQSVDYRWLLVATPEQNAFDLFDLDADKPIAKPLTMP